MSSGDDIETGRVTTGESTTDIVGDIPDEGNVGFNGPAVLRVGPAQGDLAPRQTLDGIHGLGTNGAVQAGSKGGTGVVGFGGPNKGSGLVGLGSAFRNGSGGTGVVGVGGEGNDLGPLVEPGPGVVGIGRAPGDFVNEHPGMGGSAGVIGFSLGKGDGVLGSCSSNERSGVYGFNDRTSGPAYGVFGRCHSSEGAGVSGHSANGEAVQGYSDSFYGVVGRSGTHVGVRGEGSHLGVESNGGDAAILGFSPNGHGVIGIAPNRTKFAGSFSGNVLVTGSITVLGAKSAAIRSGNGSFRRLYSVESPESWFEDFGEATLKRGRAIVAIPPDFGACIRRGTYHVFLALQGDCAGLFVKRKTARSFEVRETAGGKSTIRFSYRLVGKRKDIDGKRLERVNIGDQPEPTSALRERSRPVLPPESSKQTKVLISDTERYVRQLRATRRKGATKESPSTARRRSRLRRS